MRRKNTYVTISCLALSLALSLHVGLDNNYNSIHPHARCAVDNNIVGAYYNSEHTISMYIGKSYTYIDVGLVTGYSGFKIAPMIRLKKDNWFITPTYETQGNVGFIIGYEFFLDNSIN